MLGSDRLVAGWMEAVSGGPLGILGAGLGLRPGASATGVAV